MRKKTRRTTVKPPNKNCSVIILQFICAITEYDFIEYIVCVCHKYCRYSNSVFQTRPIEIRLFSWRMEIIDSSIVDSYTQTQEGLKLTARFLKNRYGAYIDIYMHTYIDTYIHTHEKKLWLLYLLLQLFKIYF